MHNQRNRVIIKNISKIQYRLAIKKKKKTPILIICPSLANNNIYMYKLKRNTSK